MPLGVDGQYIGDTDSCIIAVSATPWIRKYWGAAGAADLYINPLKLYVKADCAALGVLELMGPFISE